MRTAEVTDALQEYIERARAIRVIPSWRDGAGAHRESIPSSTRTKGAAYLLVKIAARRRSWALGPPSGTAASGCWEARRGSLTSFEVITRGSSGARELRRRRPGRQARVLEQDAVVRLPKIDQHFDACFIDLLNVFPIKALTQRAFELCLDTARARSGC